MTYKESFNFKIYKHALKDFLKQGLVFSIISLLILILLIPISTSAIPAFSIFNIEYTHNQMLFRFYHEDLNLVVNLAMIILGIFMSIFLFKFMFKKSSSDAYFSLGIKRKTLFKIIFISGAFLITLIILIPFIISLILNLIAFQGLDNVYPTLSSFIYIVLGFLVMSIVSFSITSFCSVLVGTFSESLVFSSTILILPTILFSSLNVLTKRILLGNPYGVYPSTSLQQVSEGLIWKFSFFNPILFFYKASKEYCVRYVRFDEYILPPTNYLLILGWIIFIILVAYLSIIFLLKRRAEIAGTSGKQKKLTVLCTIALSIFCFALIIEISTVINLLGASIIGLIVFTIVYYILDSIFFKERSLKRKSLIPIPISVFSLTSILIILHFGGLGFSSTIPKIESIKSAEITYVGTPSYLNTEINGVSDGKNFYILSSYNFKDKNDLNKVAKLHKEIIASGKDNYVVDKKKFENTTVPYDLTIKYTLKNGKTLSRYYDRTKLKVLSSMLALDDTEFVKKTISETILGSSTKEESNFAPGAFKNGYVYLSNNLYTNPTLLELNESQRKAFLKAIESDVSNQSLNNRYFPSSPPVGVIMFTQNGGKESLNFKYNLENTLVYVTESFKNTIQFLKENNLYDIFQSTKEIESITFQKYDPFVGINKRYLPESQYFMGYSADDAYSYILSKDYGKYYTINDKDYIKQLSGLLQNNYFLKDGGYLACIKIKGEEKYIYKFLPKSLTPIYVKTLVK